MIDLPIPDPASIGMKLAAGALAAAAVVGAVVAYGSWRADVNVAAAQAVWNAQVAKLRADAAGDLAAATEKTLRLERDLRAVSAQLEEQTHAQETIVADYERRLHLRIDAGGGRLRDPNAESCRGGGAGPAGATAAASGGGAADAGEAGGLFSAAATELLERLTREADEINVAFAACKSYTRNLRIHTGDGSELGEHVMELSPP